MHSSSSKPKLLLLPNNTNTLKHSASHHQHSSLTDLKSNSAKIKTLITRTKIKYAMPCGKSIMMQDLDVMRKSRQQK